MFLTCHSANTDREGSSIILLVDTYSNPFSETLTAIYFCYNIPFKRLQHKNLVLALIMGKIQRQKVTKSKVFCIFSNLD